MYLLCIYCSVTKLGLESTGAASGNAELLAEEIVKCKVISTLYSISIPGCLSTHIIINSILLL